MISIDTIIFKQGVQHLNLVWFLPSKCRSYLEKWKAVTLQEYSTSGMFILFEDLCTCHCMFFPTERERGGEGAMPMGNETILKKLLSNYLLLHKYVVCVFLSLSKIPCTGHQIGYLENTDEVPNFSPQG